MPRLGNAAKPYEGGEVQLIRCILRPIPLQDFPRFSFCGGLIICFPLKIQITSSNLPHKSSFATEMNLVADVRWSWPHLITLITRIALTTAFTPSEFMHTWYQPPPHWTIWHKLRNPPCWTCAGTDRPQNLRFSFSNIV